MAQTIYFSHLDIEDLVNEITTSGKISRADQKRFMSTLLAQSALSSNEQVLIGRVFDLLQAGRLRVVD